MSGECTMKAGRLGLWHWFFGVLMVVSWVYTALATPPSTPITLALTLSHVPGVSEEAMLTVTVQSIFDAPDTSVEVIVPAGAVAQTTSWVVSLQANTLVTRTTGIVFAQPGNFSVSARAL